MITNGVDFGAVMVPLADIAPHPFNFRQVLADLDELAASIARDGLDEPLVVMPADRVAAAWPEHAETVSGRPWVLLWGHRRLAAAGQAFAGDAKAQVPVIIRNDEVCDNAQIQLDLMTRNEIAHRSWNPIEEARAFQASVNAGRTQVEIAEMCGCHQSHVSGRLALLRLPEEIAEKVASGQLHVADARKLARLDDHAQMHAVWRLYLDRREDAWITSIDEAISEHAARVEYHARRQASLELAKGQGLRVVDQFEEFGRDLASHRLITPAMVEAARTAGTLVAGVSGYGDLEYYTTSPAVKSDVNPAEPDPNQRRAAAAVRERAGRLLAAKPPAIPDAAAHVVDSLLRSAPDGWRAIAQRWLRWLRVGPSGEADPERWWEQIYDEDWNTRVWAAHCIALARSEYRARTRHDWDEEDTDWIWRLISESEYLPRQWERHRLDRVGNPVEDLPLDWPSAEAGWFGDPHRCPAFTLLSEATVEWLERDPRRFHAAEPHQQCELERDHGGRHAAHVQDAHAEHYKFEQDTGLLHLWAQWGETPDNYRIVPADGCPAVRPRQGAPPDDEDVDECLLFIGHPGRHT